MTPGGWRPCGAGGRFHHRGAMSLNSVAITCVILLVEFALGALLVWLHPTAVDKLVHSHPVETYAAAVASTVPVGFGVVGIHHGWGRWQARGERGSAVLEAVIGAPVMILLLVTLIGAGRVANAHQVVDDAAGDAARAASMARTTGGARSAAQQTANASLSGRGVSCTPMAVSVDTSNWKPGGTVGVTLTCTAQLADLGVPILGGSRTVSARAASVIDLYRQLGP